MQIRRLEAWELEISLNGTRLFCVSGFGATQMKGTPFRGILYVGSLGRKEEAGALESLRVPMERVFGKRLERNGIRFSLLLLFL